MWSKWTSQREIAEVGKRLRVKMVRITAMTADHGQLLWTRIVAGLTVNERGLIGTEWAGKRLGQIARVGWEGIGGGHGRPERGGIPDQRDHASIYQETFSLGLSVNRA